MQKGSEGFVTHGKRDVIVLKNGSQNPGVRDAGKVAIFKRDFRGSDGQSFLKHPGSVAAAAFKAGEASLKLNHAR